MACVKVRHPEEAASRPSRRTLLVDPTVSPVGRLFGEGAGDLGLPAVAVFEELLLVVEQFFAGLGGELEVRPLDDRVDRARLLAIAAIDALRHVDVVARRAPAAVL